MNTAALVAWLTANWFPVAAVLIGGYLIYENKAKIKKQVASLTADEPAADTTTNDPLTDLISKIENLDIVKKLEITADDIKRTGRSALLIKVGDWVKEIKDPKAQADAQAAYSLLFNSIVIGGDGTTPPA